ncbi:MAG: dockerin type I repeat-containing protein [Clostridia bacterium]|nr:dockerin type I repeat-containing protein [Clostridia bacterium]
MKKFLSVVLCAVLIIASFAVFASAEEEKTVLYLDYGDITVSEDSVSGYDASGNAVTKPNANGYTVTQKNAENALARSIVVSSGSHKIELKNINIAQTGNYDYAVRVDSGASAEFILTGVNTVKPGPYRAGIDISSQGSAVISGDGTLYATSQFQAGIGGGNAKSNGTLIINSGTIYATGGVMGYSAGIGGGSSGSGGNITINGGYIVAVGGDRAAGIGGGNSGSGGNITINGGTVTASGGYAGAGIGGGYTGNGGNIVINGGSVKATAGESGDTVGNGMSASASFNGVHNSNGDDVSLYKISLTDYASVCIDGAMQYPIIKPHEDDDNLYLYLTAENHYLAVGKSDSSTEIVMLVYADGAFKTTSVSSFSLDGYKKIGDYIFTDNGISDIVLPQGLSISRSDINTVYNIVYNDSNVYTFKSVERGDVDFSGSVNSIDALYALKCSVGGLQLSDEQMQVADMNSDSSINALDALLILRKSVA